MVLHFYDERAAEGKKEVMKQRAYIRDVTEVIAVRAAKVREDTKWGLGDAIIYATAKDNDAKILTDFRGLERRYL